MSGEPMGDLDLDALAARAERLCDALLEGLPQIAPVDAVKVVGMFAATVAQAVSSSAARIGDPMSPERVLETALGYARLLLTETSADRRERPRGQA